MGFEHVPGLKGLVFVPEDTHVPKKHPCPDCFACQMCSDTRCALCLKRQTSICSCKKEDKPENNEGKP